MTKAETMLNLRDAPKLGGLIGFYRSPARSGVQGDCGPKLNDEVDAEKWLSRPGSPKAKLANGKPRGETADCDGLLQAWRAGRLR